MLIILTKAAVIANVCHCSRQAAKLNSSKWESKSMILFRWESKQMLFRKRPVKLFTYGRRRDLTKPHFDHNNQWYGCIQRDQRFEIFCCISSPNRNQHCQILLPHLVANIYHIKLHKMSNFDKEAKGIV